MIVILVKLVIGADSSS